MKGLGLFKGVALVIGKRKSAILCGVAICSMFGTVITAVKATFNATKDIEKAKDEKYERVNENHEDSDFIPREEIKLTPVECVKATWKHYIPVAICVVVGGVSIICAHHVDAKRIAAATSALMLSEKMNKELENKTIEEFGKEKMDAIKERIFHEDAELNRTYKTGENPAFKSVMRYDDGKPGRSDYIPNDRHCWFKDEVTGQEIWASRNQIERAINAAIREAQRCGHNIITFSSWLDILDAEGGTLGEMIGWDLNYQEFDITYEPDLSRSGEPCLIMHYFTQPKLI